MNEWISVDERVPESSADVTVFSEEYGVVNGYYWSGIGWAPTEEPKWFVCCGEHEGSVYDVTHWQPLPEPPQ